MEFKNYQQYNCTLQYLKKFAKLRTWRKDNWQLTDKLLKQNERANIYKLANLAGRFCQFANLTCINLPTFHFGVQIFANLPIWFADFCKLANLTCRFLQTCQLDMQTFTYLLIWPADFCKLANLACKFLPTCQLGVQIFTNLPNFPADISKLAN